MGSSRGNEKDNPPACTYPLIRMNNEYEVNSTPNRHAARDVFFRGANGAGGQFVPNPNMPFAIAPTHENMYSINQSYVQETPETGGNPTAHYILPNSLEDPQLDLNFGGAITNHSEFPLLPEWNMRGIPQHINQDYNAVSVDALTDRAGFSNLQSPQPSQNLMTARNAGDYQMIRHGGGTNSLVNRQQVNRNFLFCSKDGEPAHTGDSINTNTSQYGVQGKVDGSFLSLGIGGTEEPLSGSQANSREVTNKLKEAASPELNVDRFRQAMGPSFDAGFAGFQRHTSGFSNRLSNVDWRNSSNNDVGVQRTTNLGMGSSPRHNLELLQNVMQSRISTHCDTNSSFLSNRNLGYGDLDTHRLFNGNQAARLGTHGGNSAQLFSSEQNYSNELAPQSAKPSWMTSHAPEQPNFLYKTVASECLINSPSLGLKSSSTRQDYAGQEQFSYNSFATQGSRGSPFPHSIAAPQVAGLNGAQVSSGAPFPKRLGVEFNGRGSSQAAEGHNGISMPTTSKICHPSEKGSTHFPDHLLRPSIIDLTEDRVLHNTYPLKSQGPFSTNGQSQNALVHLSKDLPGAASTNASTIHGLSQRSDFYSRPYLKRVAVAPPSSPHWVQRQRITQPNVHPSIPLPSQIKPTLPVATHHPSIRIRPQIKPSIPVTTTSNHPSLPSPSRTRLPVPVTTTPVVAHITWQDPDGGPQVSGHKCLLCKRDLSFTSEGAVYQPAVPPAVAVLPCGHTFHDQCLHNITPQDQSKDPPCIPCAIGEN